MISMREEDFQREAKVVIVGNGGVGKTSMIRQYCKGCFPEDYKKTIGVDFLERHQYVKSMNEDVKLMLWDTAGQEEFDSMTQSYYRGAKAAIICFSTTDRKSFEAIRSWKKKVEEQCGNIPMVLVQNKLDLLDQVAVERHESEALAETLGLRFYRICVKQNLFVEEVFEYLAELYLQWDSQAIMQTPRIVIGWPKELTNSGVNLQERLYQLESATKSTACKDVSNIEKLYKEKCRKKRFDLQCNIL